MSDARSSHMGQLAGAGLARGLAASGTVILATIVSRFLGPDALGQFFLVYTLVVSVAVLIPRGCDRAIVRFAGRHASQEAIQLRYLTASLQRTILTWLILAAIVVPALFFLGPRISLYGEMRGALWLGIFIALVMGLCGVIGGFEIAKKNPIGGALLQPGFVALMSSAVVILLHGLGVKLSLAVIFSCLAAVSLATCGLAFRVTFGREGLSVAIRRVAVAGTDLGDFRTSANAFLVTQGGIQLQQVAVAIIMSALIGEVALGQFKLAERFALLASFSLTVVNSVYPGHVAEAFYEGDLKRLQKWAGRMSLLALLGALPVVLTGLMRPDFLLGLAGDPVAGTASLLRILLIAQVVNVMTGPAGLILQMAGLEASVRRVVLVVSSISVPLIAVAIWLWGTVGAALVVAGVVVIQNLSFVVLNLRELKIVALPFSAGVMYRLRGGRDR
ncbi:hypothetical protein OAL29_01235 [Candidatus Binatia bacterium]|nr:hypothetical protein [Candidatus Binatia bacterium]